MRLFKLGHDYTVRKTNHDYWISLTFTVRKKSEFFADVIDSKMSIGFI